MWQLAFLATTKKLLKYCQLGHYIDIRAVRSYFPNLDGLRFTGFLFIFFAHAFAGSGSLVEDFMSGNIHSLNYLGFVGLDFFFVLSSFLITWTLLSEAEEKKEIHFGKYFLRRALRIWPLYFLILGMGFGGKAILDNFGVSTEELPPLYYFLTFTLNFNIIADGTGFLFF